MPDVRALSRPYPARDHAPVLTHVDTAIFTARYFTRCLAHPTCRDWCCSHGVDVDEANVARLLEHADELERFTGIDRARWFRDDVTRDAEFPSGAYRRTRVEDGACVFLDRSARGCRIHAFCIATGSDYHELKPMVSTLFPLTFDEGLLRPSDEVHDHSLVCLDAPDTRPSSPTLYRGVRDELRFYFGEPLLAELDALEAAHTPHAPTRLRVVPG
ncbi:Hypothetical protein I5071_46460 [Sandaracinus amylolyticus]|nr:Hypothetical protein I5071_46460 [Sandaracinus amylolyticus]